MHIHLRRLAQWTVLFAVGVAGCASTGKSRPSSVPVKEQPAAGQANSIEPPRRLEQGSVQLTAFEQLPTPGESSQPQHDPGLKDNAPAERMPVPAEIIAAPGGAIFPDRPSLPLDLVTALGLTQAQNPRVAVAQAQVAQAYAQYDAARVLWLPSIRGGMNYNKHEGRLQDVEGENREISRGAAYGGFGANAVGAGSPAIPGVYALFHTTDAIFQKRITGFALDAREYQATAVTNDQLLETALAYLGLLETAQRKAIADATLANAEVLAKLSDDFARTGAGTLADADRAAAALALFRNEAVRMEEAVVMASARMAQQLSSDPSIQIVPLEPNAVPIELIPVQELVTADLVSAGLSNRPELAANRALVDEAISRLRREEHAPWLPSVLLGVSYGVFGAGTGGQIANGGDRFDFDGVMWWEVRNLGFGERAARDNARAQIQQARMREVEALDLVAREVVEAQAQVVARARQIEVARQGIVSAQQSYERNLERIRNAQGLPIEVLQSIQALDSARREYLRSVIDYNTAQFRLVRAMGWPVTAP